MREVSLKELMDVLPKRTSLSVDYDKKITGIAYDSRKVKPGYLFVCIKGEKTDGHLFISEALENGAAALITDREVDTKALYIRVENTRQAASLLADAFYGFPTRKLRVFGVTGTNGKTTTTYLIESILREAGKKTGLTGTIRSRIGGKDYQVARTTPEGVDLHGMARNMVDCGDEYLIMEVSSHALDMHRVDGCEFDIGVFTNLTQDHLDYHKTMDQYREAKMKLFSGLVNSWHESELKKKKGALINWDDAAGRQFASAADVPVVKYGTHEEADVRAEDICIDSQGTNYTLVVGKDKIPLQLKITGRFNIYNTLAAAGAAYLEGIPLDIIKTALENFSGVPGRFELVQGGQPFAVIIDYAHSPDGLENLLQSAKAICEGSLITVFGCGGDRDRGKRPIMGKIAGRYSDLAVITSDNPRSEDPKSIIKEIEEGMKMENTEYKVETDRKKAIEMAIKTANPKDVVVIAGKGHETDQVIKDKVIHFDDKEVALAAIQGVIK